MASQRPGGANRAGVALFGLSAFCACSLDFDIAGRQFECPPALTDCQECNADGTCRTSVIIVQNDPSPRPPPAPDPPPPPAPDAGVMDAGAPAPQPSPDASAEPPPPSVPEECAEFVSRTSDSLCLNGGKQCFSLGNVLSPALMAWLDPTTLPRDGARRWCDRSGKGHHALLQPDGEALLVEADDRAAGAALARSLTLDGGWLSLAPGTEPVLRPGNFAVLMAAAAPLAASEGAFELFESGAGSTIDLSITPAGPAVGRISSLETALVRDPVVTASSVFDSRFHLYTLYRRSEVRVLDDVLQLRLNGVLEVRASSIAIPRALDLSSPEGPRIGRSSEPTDEATGRGRVAAVVILRGSVPEDELARLENFLCESLAVCNAPGPPLDTPPAPLDGGR